MKTTTIRIKVESKKIRRIMKDDEKHDPRDDAVTDWKATRAFQGEVHACIKAAVEEYLNDPNGQFSEDLRDLIEQSGYDTETLFSDEDAPDYNDIGTIKITVLPNIRRQKRRA